MTALHWKGKEKVVFHHMDVPFKTLEYSSIYKSEIITDQLTVSTINCFYTEKYVTLFQIIFKKKPRYITRF